MRKPFETLDELAFATSIGNAQAAFNVVSLTDANSAIAQDKAFHQKASDNYCTSMTTMNDILQTTKDERNTLSAKLTKLKAENENLKVEISCHENVVESWKKQNEKLRANNYVLKDTQLRTYDGLVQENQKFRKALEEIACKENQTHTMEFKRHKCCVALGVLKGENNVQ